MENKPDKNPKSKKRTALVVALAGLGVALVAIVSYKTLAKLKELEIIPDNSQEQFAGVAQMSEELQSECQKSSEKISSIAAQFKPSDIAQMFAEYKLNAENCREVYFSIEKKSPIRSEGMYPDLVVDIAAMAAKIDRTQAAEILNFAKSINTWEFYMGPIVCNSKATIDAYLESLNLPAEKVCFKKDTDKEKLLTEIKNKNFSILSKSLSNDRVVPIGLPESEAGCPVKISTITNLVQNATTGSFSVEEEPSQNPEVINFVFKSNAVVKLILEFASVNDCLQLQSVLVPNLQANE